MNNVLEFKPSDPRPGRKFWAPGEYMCHCKDCKKNFVGDKRALQCADCAYADEDPRYAAFGKAMWDYIRETGGDFCESEWSEDVLPLAERAGLCERVEYDPEKHGEMWVDPGEEIWWWGEGRGATPAAELVGVWLEKAEVCDKLANDAAGAGDWGAENRCRIKAGVIRSMALELQREIQCQEKKN